MPTYTEKTPIPDDPVKLMDLGMKVYARHYVLGSKSPLLALQANSWEDNSHVVNNALRLHELIEEGTLSGYSGQNDQSSPDEIDHPHKTEPELVFSSLIGYSGSKRPPSPDEIDHPSPDENDQVSPVEVDHLI